MSKVYSHLNDSLQTLCIRIQCVRRKASKRVFKCKNVLKNGELKYWVSLHLHFVLYEVDAGYYRVQQVEDAIDNAQRANGNSDLESKAFT